MANAEQVARLLANGAAPNGYRIWNQWRYQERDARTRMYPTLLDLNRAQLSHAQLSNLNLNSADLSNADLQDAHLVDVDLIGANLHGANLHGANLNGANLDGANLDGANLHGADLRGTNLNYARFKGADLDGADLRKATCSNANFSAAAVGGADLREVRMEQTILAGANLRLCRLEGALIVEISGKPYWPKVNQAKLAALRAQAVNPLTSSQWLDAATYQWPGYVVRGLIAMNPNTPAATLRSLAPYFPEAFLANPVLPLLFLENPAWMGSYKIIDILTAIRRHPKLQNRYPLLIANIERCDPRRRF